MSYVMFGGICIAVILYVTYKMVKSGNIFFKIGYGLYTKTRLGYYYYRREVRNSRKKLAGAAHSEVQPIVYNHIVIHPVAYSNDNYSYVIIDRKSEAVVMVDPADPVAVQSVLDELNVTPDVVLTTHKHWDHSGGNEEWRKRFPDITIYGGEHDHVPGATHAVHDKEVLRFGDLIFTAFHTPGHTVGHVVYVLDGDLFGAPPCLFSGDLLFVAGLGKIFEGNASIMLGTISRLAQLPAKTRLFPGHEYAVANLHFALTIDADNVALQEKLASAKDLRSQNRSIILSTLGEERDYNPFLRLGHVDIQTALGIEMHSGGDNADALAAKTMVECRKRKDAFKYKE